MKVHVASRMPTKYKVNINSQMTTKIFEYYITQPVRKMGAKNHKIFLLSVCCSSEEHYIFQQHQSPISPS
jgi:hypothetical protein